MKKKAEEGDAEPGWLKASPEKKLNKQPRGKGRFCSNSTGAVYGTIIQRAKKKETAAKGSLALIGGPPGGRPSQGRSSLRRERAPVLLFVGSWGNKKGGESA